MTIAEINPDHLESLHKTRQQTEAIKAYPFDEEATNFVEGLAEISDSLKIPNHTLLKTIDLISKLVGCNSSNSDETSAEVVLARLVTVDDSDAAVDQYVSLFLNKSRHTTKNVIESELHNTETFDYYQHRTGGSIRRVTISRKVPKEKLFGSETEYSLSYTEFGRSRTDGEKLLAIARFWVETSTNAASMDSPSHRSTPKIDRAAKLI